MDGSRPAGPGGVVFVGELTVDALVVDTSGPARERVFERTDESAAQWQSRLAAAAAKGCELHFEAGGSIANVAAAYASEAGAGMAFVTVSSPRTAPASWPLWWPGYDVPALDLTARGIRVWGRSPARARPDLPGCIATIGPEGSVTHLIAWQETQAPPAEVPGELLVIRSDHLGLLSRGYLSSFSKIAVLLADDDEGLTLALDAVAGSAGAGGPGGWIFGRLDQIIKIRGWADRSGHPPGHRLQDGVTLVGTSGREPVLVHTAGGEHRLEVPYVSPTGSDLGAGDAYMGGLLRAWFADGAELGTAHELACGRAAAVLGVVGPRVPANQDLNAVFPAWIQRQSPGKDEGKLLGAVHRSPGLAVVTGGQRGVDELATTLSARSAIATHVIMPAGHRRETGPGADLVPGGWASTAGGSGGSPWASSAFPTVRIHELASDSYRYRTWASVYAADAVILLDFAGGEGSAETRRAAQWLNRPLFEAVPTREDHPPEPPAVLARGDDLGAGPGLTDERLDRWLDEVAPEAVLIAGTRASLLAASGQFEAASERVEWVVSRLVRCIGSRAGRLTMSRGMLPAMARLLIPPWLWANPSVQAELAGAASTTDPVFLPPRDVARALEAGLADAGVTWPGLLSGESLADFDVIPLGVGACYYGYLGAGRVLTRPGSVGVQYREAYGRLPGTALVEEEATVAISGSAESWVSSGLVQAAFDTFHTGRTMAAFGLDGFWPVAWDSAALLVRRLGAGSPAGIFR
jgi:hypothetical protein